MKRILPILKTVGQVLQGIALASVFGANAVMGYVMFAPDDLPKPFYLAYRGQSVPVVVTTGESTASPETTSETHSIHPEDYEPGEGVMVETGTKIVNLADPGGRRYLKASITIEVVPPVLETATAEASSGHGSASETEDPAMVAFNDAINQRLPIINDVLTTLLSGQTFESIYTVEGKEALRLEIEAQLNERLPDLGVISVYFTEFVVQ